MSIQEGFFTGIGGVPIFYRHVVPPEPKAGVLLLHGYSEHSGRYLHVMEAFADRGYAVFAEDHRGHGRTARVSGLVERFSWVLGDLAICHRLLIEAVPAKPIFLVGHSMGALLGTLYLQRYQDGFTGAILNGVAITPPQFIPRPMFWIAKWLSRIAPSLAFQPFYNPKRVSRDPEVWAAIEADPWMYKGRIRVRTGAEALAAIETANRDLGRVRLPVLITHGAIDRTVPPSASRTLFDGISSQDKTLHLFEGLLHEVHQEPEQAAVLALWADWLDGHLPPAA